MLNIRLSVLALTLFSLAATLLSGCSSTQTDPTAAWTTEKLYKEARDETVSGAWDRASSLFEKLEGRAAGTPLAQQAQIEKAYAQYRSNEKVQALATLDRFLKLHPASPAVDYALYLKGLVNFNEDLGLFSFVTKQDLSERDQKAAKDSYESFRELVSRFPESKYASDARQRMTYIVNSLAAYEVHVARYYLSRGAHVAAINRATKEKGPVLIVAHGGIFWALQHFGKLGSKMDLPNGFPVYLRAPLSETTPWAYSRID